MKFSSNLWLMAILNTTQKEGFTLSLKNKLLEKKQMMCQIQPFYS